MAINTEQQAKEDTLFLGRALELAETGMGRGDGGPFGAVIVKGGQIISEGWNTVVADKDPSAHAEVNAIRSACNAIGHFHLTGCTLYASSEPCPMCLSAAYWARVARIVFANSRSEAALAGFSDEGQYDEMALPLAGRQIPTQHVNIDGASGVMEKWARDEGKVGY
jgi:tRNA(Arg) A34 adenosine deaminase TadA